MKKTIILSITAASALIFASCGNGGNADSDGHKSIEGHADPANTGGTIGGSNSHAERDTLNDTSNGR
ncbi:MAG TPA: hypothetical protein VF868_09885 [Bacteroidia bacterium]